MVLRTSVCVKSLATLFVILFCLSSLAQTPNLRGTGTPGPRVRIKQAVDPSQVVPLKGNVHPLARRQYDQGSAPDSLPAERMLLVLQRSPEQQAALDQLLQEQQVQGSPNYHRWLTPEEFGQTFGPADADLNVITNWLTSNGFQVNKVAAGRNVIEFSGTAGQVRQAFGTQIHEYNVNGKQHWANATDPQIPAALAPVVVGISTINNFKRKPMSHRVAEAVPASQAVPAYTTTSGHYALAPYDFATIYNVLPLWTSQTNPINGANQSVAIVGRSNIDLAEVASFRQKLGLSANPPIIILNGPDPGIVDSESMEAYLDVEWAGAVAPNATINMVVTDGTTTTDGVDLSAQYIVDNNISPVVSVSFGSCEPAMGSASAFYNSLWEQAAAQGMTVSVSAGDNGSAGCDDQTNGGASTFVAASKGLAVNGLASTKFNVALGGTDFNQTAATLANYWNPSNDPTTRASAKGYIPETTWNESCAQSGTAPDPSATCPSNISTAGIWAGSGGRSVNTKPAWQSGSGVPSDGQRDLPDVSLFSATGANKSFYLICDGNCTAATNPTYTGVGGTSAAAPAFAGIMALVNQKTQSRQGNANYVLYTLAAAETYSNCASTSSPASSCVFYDITAGNIDVPCQSGSPNCGTTGANAGILVDPNSSSTPAWASKPSYDLATGLGSINVQNLVNNWSSASFTTTKTTITSSLPTGLTHGSSANVTVSVNPASGNGTPTGDISLIAKYSDGPAVGFDSGTLPSGSRTATISGAVLPGGTYNVVARYQGDGTFAPSDSAGSPITVAPQSSQTLVKLVAIDYTQNQLSWATSAVYGSPYVLRMWVMGSSDSISSSTWNAPCGDTNPATCATGHITLKDNGALLDGGDFTLSGFGWVEDPKVQLTGGTHTITASYLGDNSYSPSGPATATITIPKATTTTAAPTNPGTVTTNSSVNISAVVTAPTSNGAAPGATNGANAANAGVTFYEGSTPLTGNVSYAGTNFVPPPAGSTTGGAAPTLTATITTQFTTAGTHQITAVYNGDQNYSASGTSAATAVTVSQGTVGDFTLTATPTTGTVAKGSSGTATITVFSTNGFNSAVALTCSVTPAGAEVTCGLVQPSVTPAANGSATSTLTVTTTVASAALYRGAGWLLAGGGSVFACALLGVPGLRRRAHATVLLVVVALVVAGGTMACGGGGNSGSGWGGGDTTPPTAPTGLTAAAASTTQINLAWSASTDNVAVTSYLVERCQGVSCTNFSQIGNVTSTSFNDTGLTSATAYGYRVRATDAAGNRSAYSSTASATTKAAGTPSGTYTVTVTGTSGTLSHSTTFTVTVP